MSATLRIGPADAAALAVEIAPSDVPTPLAIERFEAALAAGLAIELRAPDDDTLRAFAEQAVLLMMPPAGEGVAQ